MYECLSRGLSVKVAMGNVIHLSAPLIVSREELAEAIAILDLSIGALECAGDDGADRN
jgi:4-aminobutyrate aminotransferase